MKGALTVEDFLQAGSIVDDGAGDACIRDDGLVLYDPLVVIDSREVRPGAVFVALPGQTTDGHRFVREVFSSGASWAVVSREWFDREGHEACGSGRRFLVADDTVKALQQLASLYRSRFSIPVVAVGGSNGKTTTKEMIAAVLSTAYDVHMSQGNRNNHLGVPLTLLQMRRHTDAAVVEMGINHPGEMAQLADIARPTHALLTNIGHEHLEFFGTLDGVEEAEMELFHHIDRNGGTVFVNTDDPRISHAAGGLRHAVRYGSVNNGLNSWWSEQVSMDRVGRVGFTLCSDGCRESVSLDFIGRHNVINAVAAAAVGGHFGLAPSHVRSGLEGVHPVKGWKRMELLEGGGIVVLNDTYNANPDSVRLALDTLAALPCKGRKIAVIGDMLELGEASEGEHAKIGSYIQQVSVDALCTFGEMARLCCRETGPRCLGHFVEREELADFLASTVREGDALLFKGSRGMRLELVAERLMKTRLH